MAHAPKKCTRSGNFQLDIISPSDFKILPARKLKSLFEKYKLEIKLLVFQLVKIVRSLSAKYSPDRYRRDKSVKFGTELP